LTDHPANAPNDKATPADVVAADSTHEGSAQEGNTPKGSVTTQADASAYVVPFVLYLVGTSIAGRFEGQAYPVAYGVVVAIVSLAAIYLLHGKALFRPHIRVGHGVCVGLLGIALWIVLSELQLERWVTNYLPEWLSPGARVSYNPFEKLEGALAVWGFIAVRVIGLSLVVPLAEELFWRGFLLRWAIDPEWQRVPIGEYTLSSCLLVTAMFTLAHPEWIAAAVYCLLLNGLLYWKRDLWQCIVAHAVSNFALAVYVLMFEAWWLW